MKTLMQLQSEIVAALNLPSSTRRVELVLEAGKRPTVKAEILVHAASGDGMVVALTEFELMPKGEGSVQRPPRAGGCDIPLEDITTLSSSTRVLQRMPRELTSADVDQNLVDQMALRSGGVVEPDAAKAMAKAFGAAARRA
jgi:hypothetical protein